MIAATETYNKPDHKYREETFAILALNAWELLFKAKILAENGNDLRSIFVYEHRHLKNGLKSSRKYIKRSRSNNPMTISMGKAMGVIEANGLGIIEDELRANLEGLTEIRDNAIHLSNMTADLSKAVQELGAATIHNYVSSSREWFDCDLGQYNFYLMPLAFFRDFDIASGVSLTSEQTNIARYLARLHNEVDGEDAEAEYAVLLELDVRLKRSALPTAARLAVGNDPHPVPVTLTEEDIRDQYPWDYATLTSKLRGRYSDFKANQKYHDIRKPLKEDRRYAMVRYLDPGNPKSQKKEYFSPNIVNECDKYYMRL